MFISDLKQVGVFNNLHDFEEDFEDILFGEFDDYQRLKDITSQEDFSKLLINESITFKNIIV